MIQKIGADIGRGYVKGYTEINGFSNDCIFKSVVALGREMDFKNYNDPIFISAGIDDDEYKNIFVGVLAEEEGHSPIRNSKDSKTSVIVKQLLFALLDKLAIANKVDIMLGVPNRSFNKSTLLEIEQEFKGKTIIITNHIFKKTKKITINDISIFREADAAFLYQANIKRPNNGKDNVMVNVGFRTTEISFFDSNLRFNDKLSASIELGNKTVLEYCKYNNPQKSLEEIDSSCRYDNEKKLGYANLEEKLEQELDTMYNLKEVNLYVCGGVVSHLNFDEKFIVVDDPQRITAKGLYLLATKKFA